MLGGSYMKSFRVLFLTLFFLVLAIEARSEVVGVFLADPISKFHEATWLITDNYGKQDKSGKEAEKVFRKVYDKAIWKFYLDRTFAFIPSGIGSKLRDDIYPIHGRYTVSGSNITFRGVSEANFSYANYYKVIIEGTIEKRSGKPAIASITATNDFMVAYSVLGGSVSGGTSHFRKAIFSQEMHPE